MNKKQANALVAKLFRDIPDIYDGFRLIRDRLYSLCVAAEKEHRKNHPAVKGFSTNDAARYFTVKYLFNGATGNSRITDIIDCRYEYLLGEAYAKRHSELLHNWFKMVAESEFSSIDYADMMKD